MPADRYALLTVLQIASREGRWAALAAAGSTIVKYVKMVRLGGNDVSCRDVL